ncbi:MAG: VOC family protein [Lachnospiraceae bacterium]|nr:VOC family protein [Blautia sp.]MBQ9612509.1 VOC family protein [Lachnospiraceae bacterium]
MNLNAIHHIAVICSDKDTALEFYHIKLGFQIIRENYRPERDDWKIDLKLNDDTEIELFIMKDRPARVSDPEANGLRHLAFKVQSVADTVTELEQMGISCEPVRTDTYTGKPMTFFRDPDGLPLEIHE